MTKYLSVKIKDVDYAGFAGISEKTGIPIVQVIHLALEKSRAFFDEVIKSVGKCDGGEERGRDGGNQS